ncbi:MAG: hypothetical protein KGQ41_05000 [Alphaproteobacteria bacterium]|nr:hypothetical protein [Alphaproteobacteria bacterium]
MASISPQKIARNVSDATNGFKEDLAATDIREDVQALKEDSARLVQDIKQVGIAQTHKLESFAQDSLETLKTQGSKQLKAIEDYTKSEPTKAICAAFAVGILASVLLSRR